MTSPTDAIRARRKLTNKLIAAHDAARLRPFLAKDMKLIGSGGAVVLYGGAERGNSGGPFATLAFVWRMGITVPIFLMMKSRSLIGVNMLRISEHQPALLGRCLHEVVQAVREGWLVPRVHQLFTADQLAAAHDALEGGRTIGKVAVRW